VSPDQTRRAICSKVAELLQKERQRQGLSMTALAVKAGLSQQSVSLVERRLRTPNLETLLRIADALQLDLGALISSAVRDARKAPTPSSKPPGRRSSGSG
jgi:transcriptional regulator with XRE-family HTH domain